MAMMGQLANDQVVLEPNSIIQSVTATSSTTNDKMYGAHCPLFFNTETTIENT